MHLERSCIFQSTLPARGATIQVNQSAAVRRISIHAPRTGSDVKGDGKRSDPLYISIHAPRTGSDMEHPNDDNSRRISIHAPRTGSDWGDDG